MSLNNIRQAVRETDTAKWYIPGWNGAGAPWIEVRQAGTNNRPFMSEKLKWEQSSEGIRWSKMKATPQKLDALREVDLPIYAKTVVVGWGEFFDDEGKEYKGPAKELLEAIGFTNFDDLRRFANDSANFIAASEAKEFAGNSQGG